MAARTFLCLLVLWFPVATLGQVPDEAPALDSLMATAERLPLQAAPDSDPRVPPIEARVLPGGGVMISGSIELPDFDEPVYEYLRYEWEVDLRTAKYRTRLLEHYYGPPSSKGEPPYLAPPEDRIQPYAIEPELFVCTANATIIDLDFLGLVLAFTYNSLNWQQGPGHPACADYSLGHCTPVCPTAGNTCWSTTSCQHFPVAAYSTSPFQSSTIGSFVNWDFLLPNLRTDVTQWNTIRYANKQHQFIWSTLETGEASSFLHGEIQAERYCY